MVKKAVRQKIKDLKEIIELWVKFNNLIRDAQTNKTATKEQEDEFLNIKTLLARKQQSMANSPLDLMNVLNQATILNDMAQISEFPAKKFYADWHEKYLGLNEYLGKLESGNTEEQMTRVVSKQKKRGRGCFHNLIIFLIFIVLASIAFSIYDKRFDLSSKIKGTVLWEKVTEYRERFMPAKEVEKGGNRE